MVDDRFRGADLQAFTAATTRGVPELVLTTADTRDDAQRSGAWLRADCQVDLEAMR